VGLYCSTQQQAQINELLRYARKETVNPEMVRRGLAMPMKIPLDKHGGPHAGASLNLKCIVQMNHGRLYRSGPKKLATPEACAHCLEGMRWHSVGPFWGDRNAGGGARSCHLSVIERM
jgi:hypothetical protein